MTVYTVALLAFYFLSVAATLCIARLRGADLSFWLRMAAIWGPFALPFACFGRRSRGAARNSDRLSE